MAKSATRLSDVLEQEWSNAVVLAARGIGILIVGALILYFAGFITGNVALIMISYILGGVGLAAGVLMCLWAVKRSVEAKQTPTVSFPCPYCGAPNMFLETPTEDFTCESCDRQVYFEDGQPVPVRQIICPACRAEHRVAISVQRFVCDSCNRTLSLVPNRPPTILTSEDTEAADGLRHFDVMLVAYDHRKENEVAFKIQNLLVVNMNEARRLMHTASSSAPLIVAENEPQIKAESIRRQLQELGATATLRPTTVGRQQAQAGGRPTQGTTPGRR
jgi:transposase-like protein